MVIESATVKFLKDLGKNNNREWFLAHKDQYEAALDNVKKFKDEVVRGLNKKDVVEDGKVFRIYRDVRFSKDKTPYKTNLGTHFIRATKARRGGYYLHLEPGESFVGGGFWEPEPADLKRIRDEFAHDDKIIRKIIGQKKFLQYFGSINGDELKTAPSGYDKDHPAIDLIRKKQFTIGRKFIDKEVTSPDFLKEVILTFEAMRPFFDYMSEILSTDANGRRIYE
ncbi:MAG TPA: DUF2461 domain-containing protein [Saprospiraceae bacterium]|nr:DUF2461 domain-containing protein [Saprospiraceae bacterium]